MRKLLSVILSAVTLFCMLCTPVAAAGHITPSGVSYKNIGTEIESLAKENEGNYASFGTAVFSGDEVLYSKHFGYVDRKNGIIADESAVYEWGSISKMLVWVSVMQLYEQDKLDLNTDIQTYLPEGFFKKLKYDEPITMLNLMNHNAGWQETSTTIEVDDEEDIISLEEALKKTEPAQVFKPGEITAYSNWGAALAGYIVECISGMDYAEYLHKNVLEPLGMEHTSVSADYRDNKWVRDQREKTRSYLIMNFPEMGIVKDEDLGTAMSFILLYPSGSVTGTLADMTKFAQAFISDECHLFEKQETLDLMLSASDFYGDSDIPKNCHGLWVTEYAVTTMGHSGNTNAGTANLVFDKASNTGVVVLTNQQSENVFCNNIPEIVFGSFENNPIYTNAKITERTDISGDYLLSRGLFDGMAKVYSSLSYLPLEQGENTDSYAQGGIPALKRISDNIYMIEGSTDFLYQTETSDGKIMLEYSSMAYIQSDIVKNEFISVIIFAVIVVVTLILLIVKGVKKLTRKYRAIPAGKVILTGQLGRLAVGIVFVLFLTVTVPKAVFIIMCIAAGISAIVCFVSAGFTVKAIFTEKKLKKFARIRYLVSILFNLFTAGFVIYFELFNFWA